MRICSECHKNKQRAPRRYVVITEKKCTKCHETKPVSEYHKRANSPDGFNSRCKVCVKLYINQNKI